MRLQYSGGNIFDNRFDVFGANLELALSQSTGVFGRYGYGRSDTFANLNPNYWMVTIKKGDLNEHVTKIIRNGKYLCPCTAYCT